MSKLLLTFDVEDFINEQSLQSLNIILDLLTKYKIRAVFFITGHMAEKLIYYPKIKQSLQDHEIGFHSSGHSVHPTIFEYCDVEEYSKAYSLSIKRETSHINPLSGDAEGVGGICALRKLFPSKDIIAYRAPGFCCPPPHLEAMAELGLRFDFSLNSLSKVPMAFKGIAFYPCPIFLDCEEALLLGRTKITSWARFLRYCFLDWMTILNFHPAIFVNRNHWDCIYHKTNPKQLLKVSSRNPSETRTMFANLDRLLDLVHNLQTLRITNTTPDLKMPSQRLNPNNDDLDRLSDSISFWPRVFFAYEPKYLRSQISRFLGIEHSLA